ncbi:MAG: ECF transporter S component [Erysipelotrichaceae bacterium]|nr:ECF transporter S component [Erysipelotrichaceae bacterium]
MTERNSHLSKTHYVTGCSLLIALAVILQYIEFAIPLMPSFIKFDFSDLPALIGAYAYGPLAGVIISFLKNVIHMLASQSGFVGELSNFILGAVFSAVAGFVYKLRKTRGTALFGGVLGALTMAAVSFPSNLFLIYPLYYSILHYPEELVLKAYQAILPSVTSVSQCLLIFNVPFTLIKGLIDVLICMLIYKRISHILKGN